MILKGQYVLGSLVIENSYISDKLEEDNKFK